MKISLPVSGRLLVFSNVVGPYNEVEFTFRNWYSRGVGVLELYEGECWRTLKLGYKPL